MTAIYTPKVGHKVQTQPPLGLSNTGTITQILSTSKGAWIEVNLGDKKNPLLKRYRPAHIVRMR